MDPFIRRALASARLDASTERELARKARAGDRAAREMLITSGLRNVALQAMMLGARGESLRDAVQAGALGLIAAVDRFDPDAGVRLATYAWSWVRGAILAELTQRRSIDITAQVTACGPNESWMWLDGLDEVSTDVVRLRFGLNDGSEPMTREQVAQRVSISVSAVRRIEAEAMRQLRHRLDKVSARAPSTTVSVPHSSIGRAFDC